MTRSPRCHEVAQGFAHPCQCLPTGNKLIFGLSPVKSVPLLAMLAAPTGDRRGNLMTGDAGKTSLLMG